MAVTASISLTENSYSVADNTSSVTCKVTVHWTYSSNDRNNLKKTLTFAGSTYTTTTNINKNVTTSGSLTLFNKTKTITHNSDGTKSISASVSIPTKTSSGTVTASKSLTLTNIPRYATAYGSVSNVSYTTCTVNWGSDSIIDYVWLSLNWGTTWIAIGSANATSGSFPVSGLAAGTEYHAEVRLRRKDSQLTTNSAKFDIITPAYPNPKAYQSLASETDTTIVMNWSSDTTCDYLWYSINGGSSWVAIGSVNASSGSYTISGLSPSTTYSIVTRVRGKVSQKLGNSSALSVATYEANYFTIDLTALENETTLTGIKVNAKSSNTRVNASDQTKLYSVRWTMYPAGNPSDKTVINDNLVLSNNSSVTKAFTKLIPNTIYNVQAEFFKGNVGATLLKSQTVTIKTPEMAGSFKTTIKSSSAIGVALTNLSVFDYDIKADLLFKQDSESESEWGKVDTVVIPSGTTQDLNHMFSGLTEMTRYNFRANLYKVENGNETPVKTYEFSTSTLVYVPGLKIVPHFKSYISVPLTGKAFIQVESTEPANDQFKIHLYSSSVEDADPYTDLGELDETLSKIVEGTVGETMYYKVGVTDSELNVYNETDPLEIEFGEVYWRTRHSGDLFDVTATEIKGLASAMIELYKFLVAVGDEPTGAEFYTSLVNKLGSLTTGAVFEGGDGSAVSLIGNLAQAILDGSGFYVNGQGAPINASTLNSMASLVEEALDTIEERTTA